MHAISFVKTISQEATFKTIVLSFKRIFTDDSKYLPRLLLYVLTGTYKMYRLLTEDIGL